MKFLAETIDKSKKPINSLELLDHVIAIQLAKIENRNIKSLSKTNNDEEETMKNLIELLKLRQELMK